MAQGKFSQPRKPKQPDVQQPIPQPKPRQVHPDPIENVSHEVAAFLQETDAAEAAAFGPQRTWQDATQVMPENWQEATQVIRDDWRTDTQQVPEGWREATQVVPEQRHAAPPTEEWDYAPQRPVVRNHIAEEYGESEDYDYEDAPNPHNKNKKIILISLCTVVLVALLGTIFAVSRFFGTSQEDDGLILPNVIAAGVDLGGMTPEQAQIALYRATDGTYSAISMRITLPDVILELKPSDTGAKLDVPAVVEAAFNHGRTGSKAEIQQARTAAEQGQEHIIALLPYLELDEAYIADTLKAYGESFNSTYAASSHTFRGTRPELKGDKFDETAPCEVLVIEVGMPGRYVDIDKLYNQVLDAYSFHNFELRVDLSKPEEMPDPIHLDQLYQEYCSTPIDAYMDMQSFEVVPETWGYGFDLEEAKVLLADAVYGTTIEIPMEYIAPEILGEELAEMLLRDTLGAYETKITGDKSYTDNLKVACQAINGTLLNPGDSFSFNGVLGKRTEADGYKNAEETIGGETVKEMGAGISQVASTLYACVLQADLDVTAREAHAFAPAYIPMGMDAKIVWEGADLKFRNNTDYPIRIDAEVSGGSVLIKLIGTDDRDYTVKVECKTTKTEEAPIRYEEFPWDNAEGYKDGDLLEEGITGYTIKTYQYKYSKETGALMGESVEATTTYQTREQVVAKVEPQPTEPPTEAPTEPENEFDPGSIIEGIIDHFGG